MDAFHFPPDLMVQMVEAIPALCRSKQDVLSFFSQAGVPASLLADFATKLATDRDSVRKHQMTRTVLERLHEGGDALLGLRRQVLKRVLDFEDFSHCWPADMSKAKAAVFEIRDIVNRKDSFTRMRDAKDEQEDAAQRERQREIDAANKVKREKKQRLDKVKAELFSLFSMTGPQKRGKLLEGVLGRLFDEYGIAVREAFTVVGDQGEGVIEQVDGAIELEGHLYLVEMKWWKDPIGPAETSSHITRILVRSDVRGLFISNSGFTPAAVAQSRDVLPKVMCILCELEEIVVLLERGEDLKSFILAKTRAITLDRKPLHYPLKGTVG